MLFLLAFAYIKKFLLATYGSLFLESLLEILKIQICFKFKEGTAKYADINSGINATLSRKMKERLISQQIKNQFKVIPLA